jgi:hypothetical protein
MVSWSRDERGPGRRRVERGGVNPTKGDLLRGAKLPYSIRKVRSSYEALAGGGSEVEKVGEEGKKLSLDFGTFSPL